MTVHTPSTQNLLDLLVCPKCHSKLRAIDAVAGPESATGFACESCRLLYASEDGLPNMLIDQASAWTPPAAG